MPKISLSFEQRGGLRMKKFYYETTGEFATVPGQITIPAAVYTQDPVTGEWSVEPGVSVLTVTGTV